MEPLILISATPSPFARMNRIALALKDIPFELRNEIPWQSKYRSNPACRQSLIALPGETQTPKYNPLEKLPILLFQDGREPVYVCIPVHLHLVSC